jgi:hypothetical protein
VPLYRTSGVDRESTRPYDFSLSISPNPVAGRASIRIGDEEGRGPVTLSIANEEGRVVMRREMRSGASTIELDVSTLPNGTYLVTIGRRSGKMVVRR